MMKRNLQMAMTCGFIILNLFGSFAIEYGLPNTAKDSNCKRRLSAKKVLYAIFVSGEGIAIQMPVKKGKSIAGRYSMEEIVKLLSEMAPSHMGFKHV